MDRSICHKCHRTNPVDEVFFGRWRTECLRCGLIRVSSRKENLGCISGYHRGSAKKAAKPHSQHQANPRSQIGNPANTAVTAA